MWNKLIHNGFLLNHKQYIPTIQQLEYEGNVYKISENCEHCLVLYSNTKDELKDNIFIHNFQNSIKHILPRGVRELRHINFKKFNITPKYKSCSKSIIEQYKFAVIDSKKVEVNFKNEIS